MSTNPTLTEIVSFFDKLVPPDGYSDSSLNGLQLESRSREIRTISFAVDCGEQVIEQAIANRSELLVVHHGLLWGALSRMTGALARKLDLLFRNGCSLYASHLPLDGSLTVGNGAELARFLGLESIEGAFPYKGSTIGVTARAPQPLSIDELIRRGATLHGAHTPYVIRAGKTEIRTVSIVTGSGAFGIEEAARLGSDLFISGEPKQEVFHQAQELKISALFLGHYATETVGVLALKREVERQFSLATYFIDIPTGI